MGVAHLNAEESACSDAVLCRPCWPAAWPLPSPSDRPSRSPVPGRLTARCFRSRGSDGRWVQRQPGPRGRHSLRAPVTDETFYFVMADRFANGTTANDTGGIPGGPLQHGFDPTHRGFFNGGDLKGLLEQIDYIQGLGTTSIWLTPSFKNKAVQLEDGPSAGYHGYWVTDFTQIDPHLGTNAELRALVDEAHERGMKVYFDIITNHTADVIGYQEGARTAVRAQGRGAVPHGVRPAVRRSRLCRHQHLPAAQPDGVLPVHPGAGAGRAEPQGAELAERRHALPQPGQHHLCGRGLLLRRLLRSRRPVHRAPDGGQRDDRDLQDLDSATSASTDSGSTP